MNTPLPPEAAKMLTLGQSNKFVGSRSIASFKQMLAVVPADIQQEVDLEFAISNRINNLMVQRGLTKLEFAQALGKRPSEVTKWLSGQHNFTIRTLSAISAFFGESLVYVR